MKRVLIAAIAVGGMLMALAATHAANAAPLAKPQVSPDGIVALAGRGGHGGGHGGFGHGGHGFGGGAKFHGGGGPKFHGGGGGGLRFYGGPRHHGPRLGGGHHHHHHHGHHHHRKHFRLYAPYYYPYYYAYSDYDDCGWLRRRAIATGSRYWWNRYYACIED